MSSKICTSFFTAFFYFLLLISSPAITTKMNGTCYGLAAARPLKSQNYATLKPETSHERHKFRGRAVDNCMPKGVFHRNSAPSKYINYHTFGSTLCTSPAKHAISEYMYKDKDRAWVEGARHDDQGTNDSPLALNANIRED
ncbi:hypothetical protein CICLE_v10033954mg [Citrus x clementina]|uniref:Uncharacterized protein n=1 Tax=Citrus clementina TaxID=85681 RepID=V4VBM9_CITCL|nr:hypothetical protein CICLE_v10033954mg [Citrus x clementina]GAY57339.1 hypothetical protein CUMW_178680 [Citrus unshiu]